MAVDTYDAANVKITMGPSELTGFADGDFLNIEKESDDYTDESGADGRVTRSKSNDRRATVTFTCTQGSPANSLLNAVRLTGLASGVAVPFSAADLNGDTLISGAASWVKKPPATGYAKESGTREWTLMVVTDVENYGGILL